MNFEQIADPNAYETDSGVTDRYYQSPSLPLSAHAVVVGLQNNNYDTAVTVGLEVCDDHHARDSHQIDLNRGDAVYCKVSDLPGGHAVVTLYVTPENETEQRGITYRIYSQF